MGTHPNSIQSTNTPQNNQPDPSSPATATQAGYRASTHWHLLHSRCRDIFQHRGPKSSQTTLLEPQTLVRSLISGRGLNFFSHWEVEPDGSQWWEAG